ncbi:uncharacterized protein LOC109423757 [Aedes albopictus]|uniref:Secreted protein n=2 Tax=Aedes albopictus TaxID=7160 RepID=A0ABM1XQ15_AEDAL|nr:uncharacterized protein LOC109414262 [Aedes albopictus]
MLWKILLLLIAHVLTLEAVFAQDTFIAPTQQNPASLPESLKVPTSTGKSNDLAGKSVVVNWKLTCQHLCGGGYGGPTCGFLCLHQQNATDESSRIKLSSREHTAICPTLCNNGLGATKCHCNPMASLDIVHDRNSVCSVFCTEANIQLKGCSSCNGETFSDASWASDVQTTTPNWDDLCTLWCRMGEGGTLCNCDLPPFV